MSSLNYMSIEMFAKTLLLLVTLSLGSISLSACNIVQGVGKDVERAGEKVQQQAQEHKRYRFRRPG
jgi:predicted small secreted protein